MTLRPMDPEDKEMLLRSDVPVHTQGALLRYLENGYRPGDFLTAVLSHDLFGAVAHADGENQLALAAIVKFIYNYCPGNCHGSKQAVKDWLASFHEESCDECEGTRFPKEVHEDHCSLNPKNSV